VSISFRGVGPVNVSFSVSIGRVWQSLTWNVAILDEDDEDDLSR
jgi:hypothetical protein